MEPEFTGPNAMSYVTVDRTDAMSATHLRMQALQEEAPAIREKAVTAVLGT